MKSWMFIRTCTENGIENHLAGQTDFTLCGLDTAGDDEIHCLEPVEHNDDWRVTCADCRRIIEVVEKYQKRLKRQKGTTND